MTQIKVDESKDNEVLGTVVLIISLILATAINALIKVAGSRLPSMQRIFYRTIIVFIGSLVLALRDKKNWNIEKSDSPWVLMRCIGGLGGSFASFYCLTKMNIADYTALSRLGPFFVALLSMIFFKEKIRLSSWLLYALAFAGGLMIIKPAGNSSLVPSLLVLCGAFFGSLAVISLRAMSKVSKPLLVAINAGVILVVSGLITIFNHVKPEKSELLILIFAVGAPDLLYQILLAKAYSLCPPSKLTIYTYLLIVFSSIAGFILGEVPDILSWIGYAVIIGASLAMYYINGKSLHHHQLKPEP
ncbi:MAG: DMT family transporter [Candidatus Cloacimonetes bacterium]|nr:DMT family transporter [Candidatus Cloacimonadota bacterium]